MRQTQVEAVYPGITVAKSTDFSFVVALQKKFSNQLGFLPRAALKWYVEHDRCLIATENGQHAGYVLGRPSLRYDRRICPITQAAVPLDLQRSAVGFRLIEAYTFAACQGPIEMMQCWCAADIQAIHFWVAMGFTACLIKTPDNARGRQTILYRKPLVGQAHERLLIPPPVAGWKAGKVSVSPIIVV